MVRALTNYSPTVNGIACGPSYEGFGSWTSVITASLQAGVAISTLIYQDKLRRDAEKKAEHEAARQRYHEQQMAALAAKQAAEAAKAAEAAAAVTAGATGGPVAVDAAGRPLPASGVVPARGMPAMLRGGNTMMIVGVLGVAAIGAIALMGRRR